MRRIYNLALAAIIVFGLPSCADEESSAQTKPGKGGVYYGGVLKIQLPEKVSSLLPQEVTNKFTRDVTYQIFESLLKFDTRLKQTVPNIAKEFRVTADGLKYILTIRDDVYFQPNACFVDETKLLTVEDVKFSLDFACSGLRLNKSGYLLVNRVKGAKEYNQITRRALKTKGVSGIKISGKNQITIELIEPFAGFEKILSHSSLGMIAREAWEEYGVDIVNNPVGTGPFILEEKTEDMVKLKRFDKYWKFDKFGNRLPYLDGFELTYYKSKKQELDDFQNRETDIVLNIPAEEIKYLLGSLEEAQDGKNVIHKVHSASSMSVMYLGFANQSKEFSDVRVRKAFNHAVNKKTLVNNWLGGEGWPAQHGFIPPLDFYPNYKVKNLAYDTLLAQKLLAEAGYPKGKNFPKIDIYVNAQKNSPMHKAMIGLTKQLKENLGVDLGIKLCTIGERDRAVAQGTAKLWRAGWIADYPHPESFLSLFYSRNISDNNNTINSFRYENTAYDDILERANKEQNEEIRNLLFVQCDQKIVDDAVVLPILTGDFIVLINKKVKNFEPNPMEILDISTIFIKNPQIEAE
jgi:oligopeptide transport system substrate-binding protein